MPSQRKVIGFHFISPTTTVKFSAHSLLHETKDAYPSVLLSHLGSGSGSVSDGFAKWQEIGSSSSSLSPPRNASTTGQSARVRLSKGTRCVLCASVSLQVVLLLLRVLNDEGNATQGLSNDKFSLKANKALTITACRQFALSLSS